MGQDKKEVYVYIQKRARIGYMDPSSNVYKVERKRGEKKKGHLFVLNTCAVL